jgi:hypothetical protein
LRPDFSDLLTADGKEMPMTEIARILIATCLVSLLTLGTGIFDPACAASKKLKQQKTDSAPSTWSKTFTTFNNYRAAVIATSDGGYLMTGSKGESGKDNGSSLWVMKTDSRGTKIWEKEFSPHKKSPHHGYAAVEAADGYLVTGTRNLSAQHDGAAWNELWVIKLTKSGATSWEKVYGCQWGANTSAGEGRSIFPTDDGGFIVGGFGSVGGATTAWLLRLDGNGNRQWEKFPGPADDGGGGSPVAIAKAAGGHFYAAFTDPDEHAILLKLDASGAIVWRRQVDQYQRSGVGSLIATSDGGTVFAGSGDHDGLLMKYDADGSLSWHKTFGKNQQGRNAGLSAVAETKDSGFIATGGISMAKAALWILRTDKRGNVVWDKEMADKRLSTGYTVVQASDGGYVVCGRDDKGVAVRLLKLDAAGANGK